MTLDALDWLDSLVGQLPMSEPAHTTLFDILGVATRETTNSNLLAYYLDERNPHGLGRLFLDSLIDLMDRNPADFSSGYTIERETNNIDILIRGDANAWAIIIENKVFHILNNDLNRYWDSVSSVNHASKYGVVVSLKPQKIDNPKFISVTHMAWLTKVKDAIAAGEAGAHSDSRHQFVFDDLFTTMKNNTAAGSNKLEKNKAIGLFQQNKTSIACLLEEQRSLQTYIQGHIDAVFGEYGYSGRSSQFYYPTVNKPGSGLRFFVENKILMDNTVGLYLELYGEALKHGNTVRDGIAQYLSGLGLRFDEHQNPSIYHLAITINTAVMTADADLPAVLQQEIGKFFTPVADNPTLIAYCKSLLPKTE